MSQHPAAAVAQIPEASPSLPAIGTFINGGYFVGVISIDDVKFGLVMAGAAGQLAGRWNSADREIEGALSLVDGLSNTQAMAGAGSKLAKRALALSIDGFNDWYIPARDELELAYRNAKPSSTTNWTNSGANANSIAQGLKYTRTEPAQTTVAALIEDEPDALIPGWYWSSTQYASPPGNAWDLNFGGGNQGNVRKSCAGQVRAFRRFAI